MILKLRIKNVQMNTIHFQFTLFQLIIFHEIVTLNIFNMKEAQTVLYMESSENMRAEKPTWKS